jgi:hypothetical protein
MMDTAWRVHGETVNAVNSTWKLWVFAAPTFPLAMIVRDSFPLIVQPQPMWSRPYDSMLSHVPAAATQATVTFPATTGRRWVIDHAIWTMRSFAAVGNAQGIQILDGATPIYQSVGSIPATAFVVDREVVGPGAGYVGSLGAAVKVEWVAGGPANTAQRVAAGAYLLPIGV